MSERERWIVYPLLFLALGAALRDKMIKQTSSERVLCEELICDSVIARQVIKTPLVQADGVTAGIVSAGSLRQNNQPVLSVNPRFLPGYNPGAWQNQPAPTPPLAPPAPDAGAPQSNE